VGDKVFVNKSEELSPLSISVELLKEFLSFSLLLTLSDEFVFNALVIEFVKELLDLTVIFELFVTSLTS
jgi:hypothetical protein